MNFGLQSLVSDISASMFKVAAVVNHPRLKFELETLAVSIAVNPCPENIFSAENLINLGREVGDIKPINAVVLVRELENLRNGLSTPPVNSQNEDIDISSKFVHKNKDTITPPLVAVAASSGQEEKPAVKVGRVKTPAPQSPGGVRLRRTLPGRKGFLNSDRDRVYQYIAEHKEVKLKELGSAFNEVSGRTIRRVTESLIKEGKIERVGSPGPTSFYRLASSFPVSFPASSVPVVSAVPASSSAPSAVIPAKEEIQDADAMSFQLSVSSEAHGDGGEGGKLESRSAPAPVWNPDAEGLRAITRTDESPRYKAESQNAEPQAWIPTDAGSPVGEDEEWTDDEEGWDDEEGGPPAGEDESGEGEEQGWIPVFSPETSIDENPSQAPHEKPISTTGETSKVIEL